MEGTMAAKHLAKQGRSRVPGVIVLLFTAFAGAVFAQGGRLPLTAGPRTFLMPLPSRFVIQPGEAGYPADLCRDAAARQCPGVLTYGGARGGLPTVDPAFKAHLPNARVTMVLETVSIPSPIGGWDPPLTLRFETSSSAADVQIASSEVDLVDSDGMLSSPVVIYDALVLGGCESLASFPVDHWLDIDWQGNTTESFHTADHSTIDSTGFYAFYYGFDGTILQLEPWFMEFFGRVNVTCTGLESLN
jgi:hypothetical protein